MELSEFALGIGFDLLVVGKGKNNALNRYAVEEDVAEEAKAKGLSPRILTSFVDATNTMIELTCAGNALGFIPDVPGGHGPEATPDNLTEVFSLKEDGGLLNGYGVVDYAFGMAPGVFVIVTSQNQDVKQLMHYLKVGGSNFKLHRPYHLTSLRRPFQSSKPLSREATIAPHCGQSATR